MKKRIVFPIAIFAISFLLTLFLATSIIADEKVCTSREMLYSAISSAKDDDVIYVGDIDFTPDGNVFNSVMRLSLNKSITLKNGKKNGNATFTNGSFNIKGEKISGKVLNVSFDGIIFDGNIKGNELKDSSWDYADPDDLEPRMCQYAMNFVGNVNAKYKNCTFKNYMYEYGGAFWARYGDYSGVLEEWFGNYSTCELNIELEECNVSDNYSLYGGGAFYLEGNSKNITLSATNTTFSNNKTGCTNFSEGGGAFRFNSVKAEFTSCLFDSNEGSYSYGSTPRTGIEEEEYDWYSDRTHGGAIAAEASKITFADCTFLKNKACNGGALFLGMTEASIDGCVFKENNANCKLLEESNGDKGPWSNMGMGGAIYMDSSSMIPITICNSSFYQNNARNAYGSIYGYYNGEASDLQPDVFPKVTVMFSSFYDNKVQTTYAGTSEHKWAEEPGDAFVIPYIDIISCFVVDELYGTSFIRNELPTIENNYSYFASPNDLSKDSIEVNYDSKSGQIVLKTNNTNLIVPIEYAKTYLQERYPDLSLKNYSIGSNYSYTYYHKEESKAFNVAYVIVPVCVVVVVAIATIVLVILKKKKNPIEATSEDTTTTFSDNEVNSMMANIGDVELTSREKEILEGILKGKKRKEIAEELFVSEATIKKYTTSLYKKMGVTTRLELYRKMSK